ncbi:MAG TPA: transglutaminase domain-containing protein [Planctomycetota bacterium]|nr:transglutaminase domain-containing protein [Planctomycetota bacterium]
MDLYRILRVSLYFLAGTAAASLSIAEFDPTYLIATVLACAAAFFLVDSGRLRSPQFVFVAALTLALLVWHFLPLRMRDDGWSKFGPATIAHFLCSLQILLLLFVPYSEVVLLLIGISSLATVLISAVIDHNANLILRLSCFVVFTSWTLFIHALWRARERFWLVQRQSGGRAGGAGVLSEPGEATRIIPERALAQGVSMTAVLSISCLAMGLLLFFSAPRMERVTGFIESLQRTAPQQVQTGTGQGGLFRGESQTTKSGWDESVRLDRLGPVQENLGQALGVSFTPLPKNLPEANGCIYLRGMAFSQMREGVWNPSNERFPAIEAENDNPIEVDDPSSPNVARSKELIRQTFDSVNILSRTYFAVAPIAKVAARRVELDREGVLHTSGNQRLDVYEIWSHRPLHVQDLPSDAVAEHPNRAAYVNDSGLRPDVLSEVRALAVEITKDAVTDLQKARSILEYLKHNPRYKYTLRLNELQRAGDHIHEFLLSPLDHQRRGHCGYFASAFVVLCRLNDLPARLVSGFAARVPDKYDESTARMVFNNADAHAWGEIFFKGYGWIIFDPTPSNHEAAPETDIAAAGTAGRAAQNSDKVGTAGDVSTLQKAWETLIGYNSHEQRAMYDRMGEAMRTSLGGAGMLYSGSGAGGWVAAVLAWAATGMMLFWMVQVFLRRGRRRVYKGSSGTGRTQAALSFYNDLLQVLSRRGFVRKPGQTPREFAEFVVRQGGEQFASVLLVTSVFESVRYGEAEMSQDEFNSLQNALDHLRDLTFGTPGTSAGSSASLPRT